MIINPSAHAMIPRRNSFRRVGIGRRGQALSIPGGKQLWLGVSKVLAGAVAFLFMASFFINGSLTRVSGEIEQLEAIHNELVEANILLRAQKARLFSPESVGVLADNQLSIQLPASGQYYQL
ncbi:MAG: hypothetical protein JKY62_15400 [Desulfocapsa sp.]|jgi:hypothetical protein|nr:hypothetical protein [Desulfocapsa sp.]